MSLSEVDARIAALQAELEATSDSSGEEDASPAPEASAARNAPTASQPKPSGVEVHRWHCQLCGVSGSTRRQKVDHERSRKHVVAVQREASETYEAAQHRPLFCRVCQLQLGSAVELEAHRGTAEHRERERQDRLASFCVVCKKQFTSVLQLKEHERGKAHKAHVGHRGFGAGPRKRRRPLDVGLDAAAAAGDDDGRGRGQGHPRRRPMKAGGQFRGTGQGGDT